MSIDAVIARSREPGQMQSRRRFTVARKRAIQKLREFALADPHHYILELIQAAIANGAAYVDLRISATSCTVAYIGGGLDEAELGQLFDFLFASKDRSDVADVRALALGLNAALRFDPDRIVVESGDGTAKGTTRMVLEPGTDAVVIGRPERPLAGTYIRIEGMKRGALGRAWRQHRLANPPREVGVIEERCLTAPIPIVVDGSPVFGFGSLRIPRIGGYRKTLEFDEGDLYGVLGIDASWGEPNFALLTYGVHIQSKTRAFGKNTRMGGIICFDALHKTVDHSGIVEDARYEEMWARLAPYVRQLAGGKKGQDSPYAVRVPGHDAPLAVRELRELLLDSPRMVWVAERDAAHEHRLDQAQKLAGKLDAPVLIGSAPRPDALRLLAPERCAFIVPELGDGLDAAHYARPEAGPPRRPWIASARAGESIPLAALCAGLAGAGVRKAKLQAILGGGGRYEVFTPKREGKLERSRVELRAQDRVFHRGAASEVGPGHVIVAEFPELSVGRLFGEGEAAAARIVAALAELICEHAVDFADAVDAEVLHRMVHEGLEGPDARMIASHRLASSVVPRLDLSEQTPPLDLVRLRHDASLEALPLFRTVTGKPVTLSRLETLAANGEGLLFGVAPHVQPDLDGLEPEMVLAFDPGAESALTRLLGDTGYVRVDGREVLARSGAYAIRDRAFGLRAPRRGSLDWERAPGVGAPDPGPDPGPDPATRAALVAGLLARARGQTPTMPSERAAAIQWEFSRREAAGHLRRHVCIAGIEGATQGVEAALEIFDAALREFPLFATAEGEPVTVRELFEALGGEGIDVVFGDPEPAAPSAAKARRAGPLILRVDAFTGAALARLGAAWGASVEEIDAPTHPEGTHERLLVTEEGELRAWLEAPGSDARIVIIDPKGRRRNERDLATRYRISGVFRAATTAAAQAPGAAILKCARALWHEVHGELRTRGMGEARGRELGAAALDFLSRNLDIARDEDGRLVRRYADPLAGEMARLAFFPLAEGGNISLTGLLIEGRRLGPDVDLRAPLLAQLHASAAPELREFLARVVDPTRIRRLARERLQGFSADALPLAEGIRRWIDGLRSDGRRLRSVYVLREHGEVAVSYIGGVLRVAQHAPLAEAYFREPSPRHFAAILLSAYGLINEVYDEVTAEHELAFQRAISRALRAGVLDPLRPPPARE